MQSFTLAFPLCMGGAAPDELEHAYCMIAYDRGTTAYTDNTFVSFGG